MVYQLINASDSYQNNDVVLFKVSMERVDFPMIFPYLPICVSCLLHTVAS